MTKLRWPVFLPLAIFIAVIGALLAALVHGHSGKFASHLGEPVRLTHLPVIGTSDIAFDTDEWKGRAYVVNFFATWCVPCHAEHEELMRFESLKIPVIGVAYKDKPVAVQAFLIKEGDPYLAAADDHAGRAGIDWGVTGVPETFIVDAGGIIRFHYAGPITEDVLTQQLLPVWTEVAR